jgi:Cu/Ag efflux pump CusA
MVVVPVVVALIFVLLYLTFRSLGEALLVVGNVPFALVRGDRRPVASSTLSC